MWSSSKNCSSVDGSAEHVRIFSRYAEVVARVERDPFHFVD